MKILNRLLAAFLVVIAILIGLIFYRAIPKTDGFYVKGADFSNPGYLLELHNKLTTASPEERFTLRRRNLQVFAHRIGLGANWIFAYRYYSPGSIATIDDEMFRKLTVAVPFSGSGITETFELSAGSSSRAILTEGGSAWPSNACTWNVESGTLQISPSLGGYTVSVIGTLKPSFESESLRHCGKTKTIDQSFFAGELALERLNPWLGTAGDHPYHETYR